ncbi:MAG: hypothetical protein H3Z54_09995 [archaeon]|nr:hypothetical protein [archaeon]
MKQLAVKLEWTSPKDIVKWLAKSWPFKDPGIPFFLWEHDIEKLPTKKQKKLLACLKLP